MIATVINTHCIEAARMQPQCSHAPGTASKDTDGKSTQAKESEILWYKLFPNRAVGKASKSCFN